MIQRKGNKIPRGFVLLEDLFVRSDMFLELTNLV
jgi:hypothetical protein